MTSLMTRDRIGPERRYLVALAVAAAILLAATAAGIAFGLGGSGGGGGGFPHDARMESQLGVRFARVAVVGDGGLITLSYVVLDSDKAGRFQADVTHPPALVSESRTARTTRVSLMKQGHTLRAGQTYYLVYENTGGALRPGERATIVEGSARLSHVPIS